MSRAALIRSFACLARAAVGVRIQTMLRALALAIALFCAVPATDAFAHPHVWVTIRSQILYAPDGSVTGVRHAWTFDDMFSAFATQGMPQQTRGQFTREELASLAKVNVTSLREYDFFTFATGDGNKIAFEEPTDYWLEYKDAALTLHFLLPVKQPVKVRQLEIKVYDETYFVAFDLAPKKPASLVSAPDGCRVTTRDPQPLTAAQSRRLSELDATTPNLTDLLDDSIANRILVTCP